MMLSINIRRFDRSDEQAVIGLLVSKLRAAEREQAFASRLVRWRWQYYANPNNPDGEPLIWVATLDGKPVGMIGTVPVKVRTPVGTKLGIWGVDLIVSKRVRGRGIGKRLLQAWITTPGIPSVVAGVRLRSGSNLRSASSSFGDSLRMASYFPHADI